MSGWLHGGIAVKCERHSISTGTLDYYLGCGDEEHLLALQQTRCEGCGGAPILPALQQPPEKDWDMPENWDEPMEIWEDPAYPPGVLHSWLKEYIN